MFRGLTGRYVRCLIYLIAAIFLAQSGCSGENTSPATQPSPTANTNVKTERATFSAGCFWGVEATFRKVSGVVSTEVGYTGGHTLSPTYEDVCTDLTGHAESVLINYDPTKVSYAELLDAFWSCHDPTTVNRQGPDVGTQYRSVIFYHNPEQRRLAQASLAEVQNSGVFSGKIITQIVPAGVFYPAEEYHQRYFEKQGTADTCHVGIATVHTKLAADAAAMGNSAATEPSAAGASR